VHAAGRREPEATARLVELGAALLEAPRDDAVRLAPERPAEAVRGSRAPVEYGGKPADGRGSTWGTTVPTGTPAISPAIAGASVRMSAITHSGRSSSMSGRPPARP
jgi:hypothetical protein